jgi:hypothetical protein
MLTAADLAGMRATQIAAMGDTCTLRVWNPTVDDYGTEIEGWTATAGVACGLDVSGGIAARENRRPDGTIATIAATLRLSLADGESLTAKDSVIITHRNGEALSPTLTYGIDGYPQRGPTGVVVKLVEVR